MEWIPTSYRRQIIVLLCEIVGQISLRVILHLGPPIAHESEPILAPIFDLEVFGSKLTDHLHVPKHRACPYRSDLPINAMILVPGGQSACPQETTQRKRFTHQLWHPPLQTRVCMISSP